jgi:hypothetical protein
LRRSPSSRRPTAFGPLRAANERCDARESGLRLKRSVARRARFYRECVTDALDPPSAVSAWCQIAKGIRYGRLRVFPNDSREGVGHNVRRPVRHGGRAAKRTFERPNRASCGDRSIVGRFSSGSISGRGKSPRGWGPLIFSEQKFEEFARHVRVKPSLWQ